MFYTINLVKPQMIISKLSIQKFCPIFPLIPRIRQMSDGVTLEVGLIGIEGMIGIQFGLPQKTISTTTIVQVSESGLRMKASAFKKEVIDKQSPLNEPVASYTHAFLVARRDDYSHGRRHRRHSPLAQVDAGA